MFLATVAITSEDAEDATSHLLYHAIQQLLPCHHCRRDPFSERAFFHLVVFSGNYKRSVQLFPTAGPQAIDEPVTSFLVSSASGFCFCRTSTISPSSRRLVSRHCGAKSLTSDICCGSASRSLLSPPTFTASHGELQRHGSLHSLTYNDCRTTILVIHFFKGNLSKIPVR